MPDRSTTDRSHPAGVPEHRSEHPVPASSPPPPTEDLVERPARRRTVAVGMAVRAARVVGEMLLLLQTLGGKGARRETRWALDALDEDPARRESRSRAAADVWHAFTGRGARSVYRLAAGPVLLVGVFAWLTTAHGLWTGIAFVGATALAVFVYLLALPNTSSAPSTPELAHPPTHEAVPVLPPGVISVEPPPTTAGPQPRAAPPAT